MIRQYDPGHDREQLWELKRSFELALPGTDAKRRAYERKLTDDYRRRYLSWVDRCVEDDPDCVLVATGERRGNGDAAGPVDDEAPGNQEGRDGSSDLVGYAFVLPARLAMVWDAAVLNEIFVRESHRGTGVADGLLDRALEVARGQSPPLDRVVLDVDPENGRARQFYRDHGFEPWGEMLARPL